MKTADHKDELDFIEYFEGNSSSLCPGRGLGLRGEVPYSFLILPTFRQPKYSPADSIFEMANQVDIVL